MAGHMVRMKDERLPERAETEKQGRCRKTRKTTAKMRVLSEERPKKGRLRKKCRENAKNGEQLTNIKKTSLTPTKGKRDEEQENHALKRFLILSHNSGMYVLLGEVGDSCTSRGGRGLRYFSGR